MNKRNEFEIIIASPPDRENLVAEIWYNNHMIYELNTEKGTLEVIFYNKKEVSFNYDDFIKTMKEAKKKLTGV